MRFFYTEKLFVTFLPTTNYLDPFHLTKNFQTFSEEYMNHNRETVKVSAN